jgi:hypothetical protein
MIHATEARQLTEIYLKGPDIDALVTVIDQRIAEAAKKGHSHVSMPDTGHQREGKLYQVSADERRALRRHYEELGFRWVDHPKTGHPCCRDFTTLSW